MMALFVFVVCFLSSTVGGICGIGGGVVIKPVLDLTGILTVSQASFLSGLTVLGMSMVSVYKTRKSNELEPRVSLPLGLGAAVGGILGKQVFDLVKQAAGNDAAVGFAQACVLGVMVAGTFAYVCVKARLQTRRVKHPAACMGVGLALGVCSSFLGIGGGPMNLAVLSFFFSMDTKRAAANSLLVILLSQTANALFTVVRGNIPSFEWATLVVMVSAGILGGLLSAKLRKKMSVETTDKLFKGLLIVIFLICVLNAVRSLMA